MEDVQFSFKSVGLEKKNVQFNLKTVQFDAEIVSVRGGKSFEVEVSNQLLLSIRHDHRSLLKQRKGNATSTSILRAEHAT